MTYNKRKYARPTWVIKPTSPSQRREPWVTIMIRSGHYKMLREMREYLDCTIGQAAMGAIETEFNRLLQEASPGAETFEFVPPKPKKPGRPKGARDKRKRRGRSSKKQEPVKKPPRPTIEEIMTIKPLNAPDVPDVVEPVDTPEQLETPTPKRKVYVPRF